MYAQPVKVLACPIVSLALESQGYVKMEAPLKSKSQQEDLNKRIKVMIVDNLMLQISPNDIADDARLFGPDGLGLDSVDALQLVVALDKNFGLKIADPSAAKQILHSVSSIMHAVMHLGDSRSSKE